MLHCEAIQPPSYMIDSEGDDNSVDMLEAAGMIRPVRDQNIIRPWETCP